MKRLPLILAAALAAAPSLPALANPGNVCPPGLAKKSPSCVPPGQAKKMDPVTDKRTDDRRHDVVYSYNVGDRLPDNVVILNDYAAYGLAPLPGDEAYFLAPDRVVYRADRDTQVVLSLLTVIDALTN